MARRLAAILAADVVGYSRLMSADEAGTLVAVKSCFDELIGPAIAAHEGRIVKMMGDGLLAEFASAVQAVECAAEIQSAMSGQGRDQPADRRIRFRIGVNLGDIIAEDDDIYGDGVDIAARLEALAEPGGVCISSTVFDHVRNKVGLTFEDLGQQQVKNIPQPLRIFRLVVRPEEEAGPANTFEASIGLDFSVPDFPSIAVLPFTVMSVDPEQEFSADGVSEAGGRVRVTAQLIDATTGLHLWAERYDRDLDDIFAVQDEITREIVVALDVQLREGEQHRVWSSGTQNLEAWESVRLATDAVLGGSAEVQPKARELLEHAIRLDPDYAIAWVMRGWLHFNEADVASGIGDANERRDARASAFRCGHRALELDPGCADAYGLLALSHLDAGEHDAANEMSEKAVALAPNNAENLCVAANVMTKSGRPERGMDLQKRVMRLCPFYRPGFLRALGLAYRMAGHLEAAVACFRESLERETGYLAPYVNLTSTLGELGRLDEAREAAREFLRHAPDFSIKAYTSGLSYENPSDLERIAEGLRQAGLPE